MWLPTTISQVVVRRWSHRDETTFHAPRPHKDVPAIRQLELTCFLHNFGSGCAMWFTCQHVRVDRQHAATMHGTIHGNTAWTRRRPHRFSNVHKRYMLADRLQEGASSARCQHESIELHQAPESVHDEDAGGNVGSTITRYYAVHRRTGSAGGMLHRHRITWVHLWTAGHCVCLQARTELAISRGRRDRSGTLALRVSENCEFHGDILV